ncbi:MAG TPA: T9SS type A sorting domain-containing protein [Hymenobacter sp.]|uniref:T9SS type A sorting domain-containing protein n=1 Tax=Hymenobacter sp. TaxID=1898978 RepID=UPI002D7E165E|nr:T9SS type A sorting domain-containing protein [Hymenobacter sp.]HET9502373.1 T9SS type A sorting domain-containing protein [Hymenobacter sp.]
MTITRTTFDGSGTKYTDTKTIYDLSGGNDYFYAEFYVTPPPTTAPGGTTVWQSTNTGTNGTNWFSAANWDNGVPNAQADAVIPENTTGSNIVFPILNNRSVNYAVRNLTLNGTTNSGRAQLTIQGAVLHVYGNISQRSGGLVGSVTDRPGVADSTANSTLILAGGNQYITGRLFVPDIIVAGSGVKSVANTLAPTNTISLRPKSVTTGVIIQTAADPNGTNTYQFDTSGISAINLGTTGAINTTPGSNETNVSYIKGIVIATGPLAAGSTTRFGNIGLEFTSNHPATQVIVQRIVGDPLLGPTNTGAQQPKPIKRQYFISGDDNSNSSSTAGSTNRIVFRYLDSSDELNGIAESNLMLFSTTTGAAPYMPYASTLDTNANTVTQADVPSQPSYYLTLGDRTNPLPVTLVSFTAARSGENAQLAWATASEKNNRGFEVQVSADGKTFRTLSFVASKGSNSSTNLDYKYTDTEAGKAGLRYYRLRQVDFDGTDSYSPVRAVSFDGAGALAAELNVYPNPVTGSDARLFIQTAEVGNAHLRITDLMGRTIIDQTIVTANGSTEAKLTALDNVKSGTYLAQLTLPSGQVKTLKVQKQ